MFFDPQPNRRSEIQTALFNALPAAKPDTIQTGFLSFDAALQIGGLPRGHIVEVFGHESSGKSTIALQAIAAAQQAGCIAAYIDAEGTFDARYAKNLGVDLESLVLVRPTGGERAFRILLQLVQSGGIDLAVIDSLTALDPSYNGVMMHSEMCATFLRRLSVQIARSKTCLLITNQLRSRMAEQQVGPPETTTGGWSVKLFSSVRIDFQIIDYESSNNQATGQRMQVKVVKNRLASGVRKANLTLRFGSGFSAELDILEHALHQELIDRYADEYLYGGLGLGSSLEEAACFLSARTDVRNHMRNELELLLGIPQRKPMGEAACAGQNARQATRCA